VLIQEKKNLMSQYCMCVLFGSSRAPLCLALFANLIVSEHIY